MQHHIVNSCIIKNGIITTFSYYTAVEEEVGMKAEEFISQFEKEAGNKLIENFWKKVNAATRFSLRKNLVLLNCTFVST